MWERHWFVKCNYRLASDTQALKKQTEAFCENQLATWRLQLSTEHFIIYKLCATHPLYQLDIINVYGYIVHRFLPTFTSTLLPGTEDLRTLKCAEDFFLSHLGWVQFNSVTGGPDDDFLHPVPEKKKECFCVGTVSSLTLSQ